MRHLHEASSWNAINVKKAHKHVTVGKRKQCCYTSSADEDQEGDHETQDDQTPLAKVEAYAKWQMVFTFHLRVRDDVGCATGLRTELRNVTRAATRSEDDGGNGVGASWMVSVTVSEENVGRVRYLLFIFLKWTCIIKTVVGGWIIFEKGGVFYTWNNIWEAGG